jgi:hypothetical protein
MGRGGEGQTKRRAFGNHLVIVRCTCYIYNIKAFRVWVKDMAFNATLNNISVYLCDQVYWWRKLKYPKNTTNLPQVTDKRCIEYTSP